MMKPTLTKGWRLIGVTLMSLTLLVLAACNGSTDEQGEGSKPAAASKGDVTLVIGAYSVARDAFEEILPKFQAEWKAKTGQTVTFQESYEASGTQARAIAGGFEADVAALAMEGDIDKIKKAGFITEDWRKTEPNNGMITRFNRCTWNP